MVGVEDRVKVPADDRRIRAQDSMEQVQLCRWIDRKMRVPVLLKLKGSGDDEVFIGAKPLR